MGHLHTSVTYSIASPFHASPFIRLSMAILTLVMLVCCSIAEHEADNAMSVQNLAIVFGPTLFKQAQPGTNGQINGMADAPLQNKVRSAFCVLAHATQN